MSIVDILALFTTVAIVALVVKNASAISAFFNGASNLLGTAIRG